jgi:6-phosphogluconolactonase
MPALRILSPRALPTALASFLAAILRHTAQQQGRTSFALAGGTTPQTTYAALAGPPLRAIVPWHVIDVFFGDERAVPPDHPHSNYHMAMKALIEPLGLPAGHVHRMHADDADLAAAARAYDAILPDRLDLLLLGIGDDGHTASLFPGSPARSEQGRRVVPARAPHPPFDRLTITPPVIAAAHHVVVLAAGAGKADAVRRALADDADPVLVPAALARHGTWFLDTAAAAGLGAIP